MRCAVCGKEFGTGDACQHCGADKFTGLGNYSGYEVPDGASSGNAFASQSEAYRQEAYVQHSKSMICYACGEIIPDDSKFCPYCSQSLWVQCPKCGKTYSSQYPVCNACGTNRAKYHEEQERIARQKAEEEQRRKQEEKRAHEEWLKSPERQEEKAKEEAKEILKQFEIELDTFVLLFSSALALTFVLTIVIGFSLIHDLTGALLLSLLISFGGAFGIIYIMNMNKNRKLEQWKKEHPNHRAIPYL